MLTPSQYRDPFITFAIALTPSSKHTELAAQYVLSIVKRMRNIGTSFINFSVSHVSNYFFQSHHSDFHMAKPVENLGNNVLAKMASQPYVH